MKYSKSAIGLLTAQYRSVLKKCWLINVGLFALGAAVATPANAENYTSQQTVKSGEYASYSGDTFTGINGALINSGTVTIDNGTVFQENTTVGGGAAIKNNAGGKITIDSTTFKDNIGTLSSGNYLYGTAIYNNGGELKITNSTFTGNEALKGPQPRAYSSAIFNGSGVVNIENTTFTGNYGEYMGGVIQSNGNTTVKLTNTTFDSNNVKDGKGSGASTVLANGAKMDFTDTTFKNNYGVDTDSSSLDEGIFNAQGAAKVTFSGKTVFEDNHATALGVNGYNYPEVTFKSGSTNTFSGNNAKNGAAIKNYPSPNPTYAENRGSIVFEEGTNNTFSNNSATENGGAVYNEKDTTISGIFTNNTAGENGGAIYNTASGIINFNDTTTFSGNTANNSANDIYNAGTINFDADADLAGGIDGEAGTVNVSGDVKVANALKNQTVNVNAGELHLDAANVTGSTVNLASDAVLNTINNAIEDYSAIKLADGSNIKVDANLNLGQMDLFSAAYGHDTIDLNIVETNMIGTSDEEVLMQLVNNGVKVNTSSVIYEWDADAGKHTKTGIVGSGNADGKVKVSNGVEVSSLQIAADETDAGTKESVVYEMGENEDFGTATVENAQFIVEGNNQSVNVSGLFGIDNQSVVTINEATFNGTGSIDTQGQLNINGSDINVNLNVDGAAGALKITDSNINVDVNVTGGASLESDPTEFSGTITVDSSSTGAFDGDTFKSTAVLKNSGTVDFTDMTFESGSKIESDTATAGTLNFNGGDYKLPITNNNINLKDGAKIALLEGSDIDGLTLTNDTNNGTIDLRNNRIDTLGSTTLGSDLNVLMDIDLTAEKSDTLGTITGGYGLNLGAVELLKLGDAHEEIQIATAGTNVALSSSVIDTLKTYYTTVSYDAGTGILTLDGKATPTIDLIGTWGTGNYIKAYNVADSANTSVGANLGYLDTQVKDNADEIASAQTVIGGINDDITVATAGTYISAGTEVANNLTALDTQVKANADAVAATDAKFTNGSVDAKFKTLNVNDKFSVDGKGSINAAGGNFVVSQYGGINAAGGNFVADKNGNVTAAGDVTAQGKLSAAGGKFSVTSNGGIVAADGNFVVDKNGKATVASLVVNGSDAMNGVDTTATSGNTTKLITSDAVAQGLSTKLTGAEAADYAVSGKRGAELAANIATYVAANGDKFADVQNTTNVITDLFNDKALYIQETTGMDQAHSVAYNYNQSTQDLLHGATSMLNADEKLAAAVETKVNNAGNFTADTNSALIKDKTVVAAIQDTAAQVDVNTAKNTTQDTALTNLYTAVNGGTYNAADASVSGATTLSSNFTATNLTAAANELLADITVTDDGNYIKANKTAAQNLGILDSQVKTNADDIAATAALVGTTSAPKTGTGILAGKTITGTAGTNNLNMVDAIAYVADNAAGLNVDNKFTGKNTFGATEGSQVIITNGGSMSVDKNLTIGKANAISSSTNATIDMGENTLTNVKGLTLTDGNTHTASLSANENGLNTSSNLTIGGYVKATGIDTSETNTVKLGGTGFTTAVTGNMTVSGNTTMTGDLAVNGDTTLKDTSVAGDLSVTGDTTLANTSVNGTLGVTGAATFGDTTDKFVDITNGAITVHDGTGSANVTASIANNGDITTKGALDVAGLASLDGGINVNDKFAVDTNGKVTLSDGTNTATIEATQIKDSDGNPINNVMKVNGTGLYTGYVASESGFTVAQKDAVSGLYEETFTVNADGEITGVGLTTDKTNGVDLGVAGTTTDIIGSAINIGGAATTTANLLAGTNGVNVSATGTDITGNFSVATDKFTVDSTTGNTAVAGTMDIEGDTTIGNKFSVTATDGSFSAAGDKFSVNHNGAITAADGAFHVWRTGGISAANGNFTVDKDGNTAVAGTMDIEGDTTIGDKFSVTATDGSMSAAGGNFTVTSTGATTMNDKLTVTAGGADITGNTTVKGGLYVGKTGKEFQVGSTGHVYADGSINSKKDVIADGKVQGKTFTNTDGSFQVGSTGNVYAQALAFNSDQTKMVNKIDQGAAAITDGVADTDARKETMATTATVAKTIGKLDDKNAHGVTEVSDVASAISSLSKNVETATGGTFAGAVWTGAVDADKDVDYTYSPAATATATAGYHDIMSAVSQVASNIGAATTVAFNNVADDNTVNANIDALNRKVGNMNNIGYGYKNLSNGTTTQPDTVVEALRNIDASMGTIHGLAAKLEKAGTYQGNLAEGTTVEDHLTALDTAIGDRSRFNSMHYTKGAKSVVDAVGKLDNKLGSLDHDVRTLRHHFQSGMASAAALSALVPNARAHGNTQLSLGTGMYHGHGAMAIGGFHWFSDNLLFNTGIAWDDNEATYRMGVTYSW